jgi:hypothetical protein
MTRRNNVAAVAERVSVAKASVAASAVENLRLVGTKGASAAVGQALEVKDGNVVWKLHPAYGAWFWPLMHKLTELVLTIPEGQLEPVQSGDTVAPPRAPSEVEKDKVLKMPELAKDELRVYKLVIKGKTPSVSKAFPKRTASLSALRYCCKRVADHP